MKAVGILIAKENSNRFPGKNFYIYKGMPLCLHNYIILSDCSYIDKVYLATNIFPVRYNSQAYITGLNIIPRNINIIRDDQPFIEVLKYAYQTLPERYDIIVSVLANTINHTLQVFENAIEKMIREPEINEIRSFNDNGDETGVLIFRERVLLNQHEISSHLGMVKSNAKEIHYKEDLL